MKRTVLGLLACALMTVPCALRGQEAVNTVTGLVIEPAAAYVQVKSGWNEIILYYADTSQFQKKDGTAAAKDVVEICQVASASYVLRENRYVLVKYQVLAENYCRK
jgi:hypothetical protein